MAIVTELNRIATRGEEPAQRAMNYWIFNAAPYSSESESYTARQIYQQRMQDRFWGLGTRTQNRKNLRKGDKVVFYIARPEQVFAGTAELASDCFDLNSQEQRALSHDSPFFTAEHGVRLEAIETWERSRPMAPLSPMLNFIKNPRQWWTHLQGGVRQVDETDYTTIVSGAFESEPSRQSPEALASESLFALEAHLEDFIAHNWDRISWDAPLELYRYGEQTGRQYPAGTWSIDFLAIDHTKSELVVIELKRGHSGDATVGQILRYMNWIRENIATGNQNVRGIIVASEIDEKLRYAVRGLPDVSVKTYNVTFTLQPADM
jgi:hypothetical protein